MIFGICNFAILLVIIYLLGGSQLDWFLEDREVQDRG